MITYKCGTCGHKWKYGKSGDHSCALELNRQLSRREYQLDRLIEAAKKMAEHIHPHPNSKDHNSMFIAKQDLLKAIEEATQ